MKTHYKFLLGCLVVLSLAFVGDALKGYFKSIRMQGSGEFNAFEDNLSSNSHQAVPSVYSVATAINGIAIAGSNPFDVINIKNAPYNAVGNANVVGSEDTARGTDAAPAINAAIAAAKPGQMIFFPAEPFVIRSPITLPSDKQVFIYSLAEFHTNKRDGFRIVAPSGTDPQHRLYFFGRNIGRENMPSHTKATHDAGTQPNWAAMTNAFVKITDCDKNFVFANRVEGFGAAFEIDEDADGSQENIMTAKFLYKNRRGIFLHSTDGTGFIDKNYFSGENGGTMRISGGLAIELDGYSGTAVNGEVWNCAMRANRFENILAEQVDSLMTANGDITEPYFKFMTESGVNTGIFGNTGFQMRSVSPNYVRSPTYIGSEFFCTQWMTQGMGINAKIISTPLYVNCSTLIGSNAETNNSGTMIVEVAPDVSAATRALLPGGWLTKNATQALSIATTTASSYAVPTSVSHVFANNTANTSTLPAASSMPGGIKYLFNNNANAMTAGNVASGWQVSIPGKMGLPFFSDGTSWYPVGSATTGGSGTTETASNGLNKVGNDIRLGGALTGNTTIPGASNNLSLGTSGSLLNQIDIYSSVINLQGGIRLSFATATDANYAAGYVGVIKLPAITANRTFTFPVATAGTVLRVWNANASGNTWVTSFKDAAGSTVTSFSNGTFITLIADGTNWVKMN